ncbi:MAG: MFS transporter [Candidatus Heimdallarchaeota archaeon]
MTGLFLANFVESVGRGGVDQFMPIYARVIGGSISEIGLMTGLFSLASLFQFFWAYLSQRLRRLKIFVVLGWIGNSLLFIPMMLLKTGQMTVLIIIRTFQAIFHSSAAPTLGSILAEQIPLRERASRITFFTRIGLLGVFLGTLAGGTLISFITDSLEFEWETAFLIAFGWTIFLGFLSSGLFHLTVYENPSMKRIGPSDIIENSIIYNSTPSRLDFYKIAKIYLTKFLNFWVFCNFAGIYYFAVYLAGPFFVILSIEIYGFSFFMASILTSVTTAAQFLASLYISKVQLLDRYGRRFPLLIGIVLVSFATISVIIPYYLNVPTFLWCIISWIILGSGWGIVNGSISVFLLDLIHPQYRLPLIAAYNTITGLTMFIGALVGGILTEILQNVVSIFMIRSMLTLFTLALLARVKEPMFPGSIVHPRRNFLFKDFRSNAGQGPELVPTPVKSRQSAIWNRQLFRKTSK